MMWSNKRLDNKRFDSRDLIGLGRPEKGGDAMKKKAKKKMAKKPMKGMY